MQVGVACCAVVWLLAAGCADGVQIIGRCELENVGRLEGLYGTPSVGLVDGHLLVTGSIDLPPLMSWGRRSEWWSRWYDRALVPTSDSIDMGEGIWPALRTRWVRDAGRLRGAIWVDPMRRLDLRTADTIYLWSVAPPPILSASAVHIVVNTPPVAPGFADVTLDAPGAGTGLDSSFPVAMARGRVLGGLITFPLACGDALGNHFRLHVFGDDATTAHPVLWGDPPCGSATVDELSVGTPWLFDDPTGAHAALVRDGGGHIRLLRLNGDLTVRAAPPVVGPDPGSTVDGGNQPRAVSAGGNILYMGRRGGENYCHRLMVMRADGSNPHDAPWQLPCMETYMDSDITASVELVAVPRGAVLLWGQRSRISTLLVREGTAYREAIYATLLTPEGRRGSEIVRVTDDAATVLADVPRTATWGPAPRDFLVSATSENEHVVAAWADSRVGGQGIYVRNLRCIVDR